MYQGPHQRVWIILFAVYTCLLLCFVLVLGLSCSRLCHAWSPLRAWYCLVTSNAHEALFRCDHLGSISKCRLASYIPFPFCFMRYYAYHVCLHHPLAFYASLHACSHVYAWVLVCHPCFNTMKLWTFDPNLHLSLADTTFFLLSCLFAFSLVCLLSCFFACHVYHAYLLYASFICSLNLFLPLPVC